MYPGIAFGLIFNGKFEKLLIFTILALIGLFIFYQSYSLFKKCNGFLKRLIISTVLVSSSLVIEAISPEAQNASAGAFLFLVIPSLFISIYLLHKSKPALKVKALYQRAYNKSLKQDK